ncbi:MAG: hypothetical protein IPL61_09320 [Myxococcales bacterium]|nr:hypothetical protein [Myxococcales bacterium]
MVARSDSARAVVRLAAWCLALSVVVSRAGLVVHELVGHGLAALAVGGSVTDLHLYWFAGGWIEYGGAEAWSPTAIAVVSLAGVTVEVVVAAGLAAWNRRRPALALAGAAWALTIHAALYLAVGAADGVGDGAWVHQRLGGARGAVAIPAAVAALVAAAVASRRLGAALIATLPPGPRARRVALLALALALAGGAHAALVVGELQVRPDPTYARVMATERARSIAREVAAWRAEAAARGELDAAHERAARRTIAARHQARRWGPWLVAAVALIAALGLARARARGHTPLADRDLTRAGGAAAIAVIAVAAIDVAARAIW